MQITPNILKLMSLEDRKSLGRAGMTPDEAVAKQVAKSERDLQIQIGQYLRLHGIEYFQQRMDKRATGPKGQPDFLFAVNGVACAFEVKLPGGKLEPHQEQMAIRMSQEPNQWRWWLITSLDEVILALKEVE